MYKVVIIDDEPWTRATVKNLFPWQDMGLEIVGEAADGETGLALIKKVLPDIIITDVCMPRENGLGLAETLRKEGNNATIIVISGYDDYDYMRRALKLQITDYILKPVKRQELSDALNKCIHYLKSQPSKTSQVSLAADFWETEEAEQYQSLAENIGTALFRGDEKEVSAQFSALNLIADKNENVSTATQISIYYRLVAILRKYMETMNLAKESVFSNNSTTFVFSRDNNFEDMLHFIMPLYFSAIRLRDERKSVTGLDIRAVSRYIDANYTQGITLEDVSSVFHVSKEHLSKTFKSVNGVGFSQYILSLKMNRAMALIKETQIPLKDICEAVGYYDMAHFHKSFKKFFGKTPKNVQDSLKNDNETTQ